MEFQDKYDDLDNLESSLQILVYETLDRDYKEELEEMLTRVQIDKEKIELKLQEECKQAERERNIEFERSRLNGIS